VLHEHRRRARRLERQHAGEQLVAHDAERVLVAPAVELRLAERLLGTHVRRGAERRAGHREPLVLLGRPRDAEVGDHRASALAVEQHVVGLHVAVHHAARVRVAQPVGDLGEHARGLGRRRARRAGEARASVSPSTSAMASHATPPSSPAGEDRHDVGVRELGGGLRLARKRARTPARNASSGGSTLSATGRWSRTSTAR
jgi:hypothetical protein